MYLVAIGEIFLKGKNRINFERRLIRNIRSKLNIGPNDLLKFRNRYIIINETNINELSKIFGIIFYVKLKESKLDQINQAALSLITQEKTFRISARKSILLNKSSTQINEEVGDYILKNKEGIKVKLEQPEIDIRIEELRNKAYLYKAADIQKGLGGLPLGSSGFIHLRVQDEVKSVVAAFLLMKRGCVVSLSKDLMLLHKLEQGFDIKEREEKENDISATDETFEEISKENDAKFTLRPLVGYTEKEIESIYKLIESL